MMRMPSLSRGQRGFTLIEVLVAILITAIGVLGAIAMQMYVTQSNFENQQRSHAMVLVRDAADKIQMHRQYASCFAYTTDAAAGTPYLGTAGVGKHAGGLTCAGAGASYDQAVTALADWDAALQGAAERLGANNVGAMVGARGCISVAIDPATSMNVYTIAVAWQGSAPLFTINDAEGRAATACGKGLYGAESQRRVIWTTVRVASLKA